MAIDKSLQASHNSLQRAYYENRAPEDNRRVAVNETEYIRNHIEKFVAFGNIRPGELILDVGCGMGKYTLPLALKGLSIEALDLSPVLLDELANQANGKADIPRHCGDVLDPEENLRCRFDVVTGFFMLHHLLDIGEAWQQFRHLLKPGGRAVFLDVNPLCPLFYLQITLTPGMSWKAEKGILNLARRKIAAASQSAGFEGLTIERFGILPPALRNRPGGLLVERAFDGIAMTRPLAAFQLISAVLPAA